MDAVRSWVNSHEESKGEGSAYCVMMNMRVLGSVQFMVVLQERLGDKYNESFDSLDNFEILCWVVELWAFKSV